MPTKWKFITIRLHKEHKKPLEAFVVHWEKDYNRMIQEVLSYGYKVSFSWIDKQTAFVVSVSGNDKSTANNGCTITSWSDDLNDAISIMAFKVLEFTKEGNWEDFDDNVNAWG